jgi:hypothetical protein
MNTIKEVLHDMDSNCFDSGSMLQLSLKDAQLAENGPFGIVCLDGIDAES